MKTTTLTALFLISCAMALMGCDTDNGGSGPDGDKDAIGSELEPEPDCIEGNGCVPPNPDIEQPDLDTQDGDTAEVEIEDPMPEAFLWWATDWKCVSLETCWILGDNKIMTLEFESWDAQNQVAHFYGLTPCDNWEITHDGTSFQMTGYTPGGIMDCQLTEVNGNLVTFSWSDSGGPEPEPWIWERQ